MPSPAFRQFYAAAVNLEASPLKSEDMCLDIIDQPDFHTLAALNPDEAAKVLTRAFNTLDGEDTFQAGMALLTTAGAEAIAQGEAPERLIDVLVVAKDKLSLRDQKTFTGYVWQTRVGQILLQKCPNTAPRLMVG